MNVVDLANDGNPKIVTLFRMQDPNRDEAQYGPLLVDVIELSGEIAVHLTVTTGRNGPPVARALPGRGVEVWDCRVDCVPTALLRYRRITYQGGRWQVVEEAPAVPPHNPPGRP